MIYVLEVVKIPATVKQAHKCKGVITELTDTIKNLYGNLTNPVKIRTLFPIGAPNTKNLVIFGRNLNLFENEI
jgi:hypothetical protein